MTFSLRELSIFGGRPTELYRFVLGAERYCFTSADSDVSFSNEVYDAVPIKRARHVLSTEMGKNDISIDISRDNPLCQWFVGPAPDEMMLLTIYRMHAGDTDYAIQWQGRVTGASVKGSEMTLSCEPMYTSLKRPGLRAKYQTMCRHPLASHQCGVNPAVFSFSTTIASVAGTTITLASIGGKPDNWLAGGWFVSSGGTKRMIQSNTGPVLTITHPARSLMAGESVLAYAGCDHLWATCKDKFGNAVNFGGFPWMPKKNPFSGDGIA